ncbi:hypothetical protein G9C98_005172 [Cotesia typhae]|uniref:ER membrane protein complex subunit 4 n=1 Tax=Cotesia typhae TaxID=2053667 RepID=A0A8J5QYJ7_9HYME|nr:hypothetical protein G9C98_005172 [Cotesia typhae]
MSSSSKQNSKKFKWNLDFAHKNKSDKNADLPNPPGYNSGGALYHSMENLRENDSNHLIIKKSWDLALGPLKQVPMNLFIMFMADWLAFVEPQARLEYSGGGFIYA